MAYVDTVDYQARKFSAAATTSIFLAAAAGMLLDLSLPVDPPKPGRKEQALVMFPVPGERQNKVEMKVFDVPKPLKTEPKPEPKPQPKPVEEQPSEKQQVATKEVSKPAEDSEQVDLSMDTQLPTFWTPPPPKVTQQKATTQIAKRIELPRLTVNTARSEEKLEANRPPRLVQAREQRMDDAEVINAVRELRQQIATAPRPATGSTPVVSDGDVVEDGTVALRFQVMPDGTISGCSVVASSGSDVLDRRACDLVATFVYEAGTDENGVRVERTMIENIEWVDGEAVRRGEAAKARGVVPVRGAPAATPIAKSLSGRR